MLRLSSFHSSAALLCLSLTPLAAQVDSVEVTPHNVSRPVTQNTGTGVGACQQFLPWAYDVSGSRVRQQQTYSWSVSNSTDFQVDTAGGNVCARQSQLTDTVTTTVTATVVGTETSGTANFTATPDPTTTSTAAPPPLRPIGTVATPTAENTGAPPAGLRAQPTPNSIKIRDDRQMAIVVTKCSYMDTGSNLASGSAYTYSVIASYPYPFSSTAHVTVEIPGK